MVEPDFLEHAESGGDMSMRQTSDDAKVIVVVWYRFAGEPPFHDLDQVIRQIGEISEGQMFDLAILAVSVPEQMGDIGLALALFFDRGYVNGSFLDAHAAILPSILRTQSGKPSIFWLQMEYKNRQNMPFPTGCRQIPILKR